MAAQSKTDLVIASVRRLLRVGATANLLNLLHKRHPVDIAEILRALNGYVQDRIVMAITHRVSAAQWADRVLVLNDGNLQPLELGRAP